ncbi:transcriptional regulator [Stutzerimonas nosocomialis]|uniref:helix-turn-helix domain-containing protein n=1 Tax=Stutzerimonas nosocomialis TaxID=1056496 RepID=UPI001107DDA6|nr:helix-turn-helix transcriptional regulator [Stutzerimonas nosocomialis]TLX52867.1 transcriptional regulator [Stutzerimonas nosocomialis]
MSGLGERLREERKRLGLSQADFGALGGVKANAQGKYESDERSPDAAYLNGIMAAGVDVLYVLTGSRTPLAAEGLQDDESQVLNYYRAMPDSDRATLRRMASALAESAGRYDKEPDR